MLGIFASPRPGLGTLISYVGSEFGRSLVASVPVLKYVRNVGGHEPEGHEPRSV